MTDFKILPIKAGAKAPPLWRDWPQRAAVDAELPEGCNVGIHCDGMIVLDIDINKGGEESLAALEAIHGLPETREHTTPSGGRHVFYRCDTPIRNSVEVIGKGIDVRSKNGYVVAPPSTTAAGSYSVRCDRPIAQAPEWLVHACGVFTERERPEVVNIPDADSLTYERAREWLAQREGAVEGDAGDAATYAVACGLRDFGLSKAQALDLLTDWNAKCSPPWSPSDLGVKVDNAYNYATGEAGAKVVKADEFPEIVSEKQGSIPDAKLLSLTEFASLRQHGNGYVIKGLLQRGSYAELFGAPGEGKTFVSLDMAYHVAAGREWMGRKVHAGPVLYLAYEGTGGLVARAQALVQHYGEGDVPLFIHGAAYDLRKQEGRASVGALIAAMPAPPALIVIDTFARALMGGDENSAQDVGAFNTAIGALIESTGACVCIIHHSGKDKSKGARGSSALLGAIDTDIQVDEGTVTARKQRDVELTAPIGFRLSTVVVGIDSDGDALTSCVVLPADATPAGLPRLTGNPKRGFDTLVKLRPDNKPVTAHEWKEACKEFLGDKQLAQRFFDIKGALLRKRYIAVDDEGMITRRME